MIHIKDKKGCCGCSACEEICPKGCILMKEDEEGFMYPEVDTTSCVNCRLCEKVCPVLNQSEKKRPIKIFAATNTDEKIREASSSGGIFTLLAQNIIEEERGVVFGAKFNKDWEVVHDFSETTEGLSDFRGSKYVQSDIGNNYQKAESFLKEGRKVLFSGTPCQIAGLKKFLRKDYGNLLTIDIVCHGVPSPRVWKEYLSSLEADKAKINRISFRDKSIGWKDYCFSMNSENSSIVQKSMDNTFMKGFLTNVYQRPSCYCCAAKSGKSGSDITLADFWGISNCHPEIDDDRGTSLVMLNTDKGLKYFIHSGCNMKEASYDEAIAGNPSIERPVAVPAQRKSFFRKLRQTDKGIEVLIENTLNEMRPSFLKKCMTKMKKYIAYILR